MKTPARLTAVLTGLLCTAAVFAADAAPTFDEKQVRETMGIPVDAVVAYLAEDGSPLTREEFARRVGAGDSFGLRKNPATGAMAFTLRSPETVAREKAERDARKRAMRIPPMDFVVLGGKRVTTASLEGKPTLVNFFFEHCVPCIKEVPVINAFAKQHPEYNYLAITPDDAATAARFVSERKLEWPVAADASHFIQSAGITGYPTYLLLDTSGKLLGVDSGFEVAANQDIARGVRVIEQWIDNVKAKGAAGG
jgi:thiol-disulfide isomerase/thioredoxin